MAGGTEGCNYLQSSFELARRACHHFTYSRPSALARPVLSLLDCRSCSQLLPHNWRPRNQIDCSRRRPDPLHGNPRAMRLRQPSLERGAHTLSSVVASQIATHARYGGVVPELASRAASSRYCSCRPCRPGTGQHHSRRPRRHRRNERSGACWALAGGYYLRQSAGFSRVACRLSPLTTLEGHIHAVSV